MRVPSEAPPFIDDRLDAHDVIDGTVELIEVAIDDADHAGEPVMGAEQSRLPHLLEFAIADQDEGVEILPQDAAGKRHAAACGKRVADRARAEVDAGNLAPIGMVAKRAAEPRIVVQPFLREEIEIGEDRKESHRRMALPHEKAVAVRPLGLAAPQVHHVVVEDRKNLSGGEGRRVVAHLGDLDQSDCLKPREPGFIHEERNALRIRHDIRAAIMRHWFAHQ